MLRQDEKQILFLRLPHRRLPRRWGPKRAPFRETRTTGPWVGEFILSHGYPSRRTGDMGAPVSSSHPFGTRRRKDGAREVKPGKVRRSPTSPKSGDVGHPAVGGGDLSPDKKRPPFVAGAKLPWFSRVARACLAANGRGAVRAEMSLRGVAAAAFRLLRT